MQSTDYGATRIRMAAICWVLAAAILIGGVAWLGAPGVFDMASPDFFPLPAGFAAALVAFGFVHLGQGLRDLARRRKTGLSRLDANSAALGARFEGRIRTEKDVGATGPYVIQLSCLRTMASETDDGSSRRRTVILWEKGATSPKSTRSDVGVPFSFDIPANGLPSGPDGLPNGDSVTWKLKASAPTAGLNYVTEFLIDVRPDPDANASPLRSVDDAFQGHLRPEQSWAKVLRYALPAVGALLIAAGGYGSINQVLHSRNGVALTGSVSAFNRPQVDIKLDGGQAVIVPRVSSHLQWREGQRVTVTCREDSGQYGACRMDTGFDRWTDALATLAIGLAFAAIGVWLWRRRRPVTL